VVVVGPRRVRAHGHVTGHELNPLEPVSIDAAGTRSGETDRVEVPEKLVDRRRVFGRRPSHGVADTRDQASVGEAARERDTGCGVRRHPSSMAAAFRREAAALASRSSI
jgi:hypothetical protein